MTMESSGVDAESFIAQRIPAPDSEPCFASRDGPAAARSGKSAAILAPSRPLVFRFATYFAARNHPRGLLTSRLLRAARLVAEELPELPRKPKWRHTASLQATQANRHLPPRAHSYNPVAPDAPEIRRQVTPAIPRRPHLAPAATAPLPDTRSRRQSPARARCR